MPAAGRFVGNDLEQMRAKPRLCRCHTGTSPGPRLSDCHLEECAQLVARWSTPRPCRGHCSRREKLPPVRIMRQTAVISETATWHRGCCNGWVRRTGSGWAKATVDRTPTNSVLRAEPWSAAAGRPLCSAHTHVSTYWCGSVTPHRPFPTPCAVDQTILHDVRFDAPRSGHILTRPRGGGKPSHDKQVPRCRTRLSGRRRSGESG